MADDRNDPAKDPERDRLSGRLSRFAKVGAGLSGAAVSYGANRVFAGDDANARNAKALKAALGGLKGPLMKAAQMFATVPDLLPPEFAKEFAELQTNAPAMGWPFVRRRMAAELGPDWQGRFASFEHEAAAAASLGQVHAAALRDGRSVVVKVQRPDIRKPIAEDIEVLEQVAGFFDAHTDVGRRYRFLSLVAEFRQTIHQELNYEREAQNLITVGENLKDFPSIVVPQPVSDYSTRCVLTMERIEGHKITKLGGIARLDLKGAPLADDHERRGDEEFRHAGDAVRQRRGRRRRCVRERGRRERRVDCALPPADRGRE